MLRKFCIVILFIACFTLLMKQAEPAYNSLFQQDFEISEVRFSDEDDPAWRNPDDATEKESSPRPPSDQNVYWWSASVTVDSLLAASRPLGVGIWAYEASYELYWDGVRVGMNGVIEGSEVVATGPVDNVFLIPDSLSKPGTHTVSGRVVHPEVNTRKDVPYILVRNHGTQSYGLLYVAVFLHVFAGMFLIVSIYYALTYVRALRQRELLLLALMCFFVFLFIVIEYVRFYLRYDYTFHQIRLHSIEVILSVFAICGAALLSELFSWRILGTGAFLVIVSQAIPHVLELDHSERLYFEAVGGFAILFGSNVVGYVHQREGSYIMLFATGALASVVFFPGFYFLQIHFIVSACVLAIVAILLLSRNIARQKQAYQRFLFERDRLKTELLKKNIQPHFLMNTLTSLISWVEESPSVAVKFIEALAREFELVIRFSELRLVEMGEEIKLCRTHLETMQYRYEQAFDLKVIGVDPTETIPPGVILTLVENGMSHMEPGKGLSFIFSRSESEGRISYSFNALSDWTNAPSDEAEEGMGLAYVKARLQEAYGNRWKVTHGRIPHGWNTTITLSAR